ncbi:sensor histidine kinase [Streptomyces sp. Je 1-4]|uniref:sensor histidine kinase n=1 Tax=Streptomyces TaxID=1883 RepID=UPI0021D95737|nr:MULTISPECIES: sensor histidine kinase [unclassified Streptomyces]UYB42520.1 sensor histidine kinase [Streptomyces sp. Je 1-4]UZQ38831.1 sensor histidine kinase [Streptomyces sp. Je 1-4] [Streptomyces sp. Je 1-4 4N24]UZQ46248.1 sensor histidine kinase [Streptomyces sp. Je 1-4] [Streptomyces sp. Je 1-4 4N24_ara]
MTVPPRLRRALVRMRRDLAFVAAGVPLHLVPALLSWWAVSLLADTVNGVSSEAPVELIAPLTLLVIAGYGFTEAQRRRFRAICGVELPRLRFREAKRQFGYNLLIGPLLGVLELLLLTLLLAASAAALVLVWVWLVPPQWRRGHPGYTVPGAYLTVLGLVALAVIPGLAAGLGRLEILVGRAVLGVSRSEELARRVEDLTESRAGAVDAADAERRRIERDLHDGAQQRLVSLALNLGLAKATLTDLPPQAQQVIDAAHREAKDAIEELNNLVRGLHPAVLDELGLDAALSGLAARAPLPVRLRVDLPADLPQRTAPAIEAVAYFVVSEALTNIAKHAREATRAEVTVTRLGGILRVVIADDGMGGADPARGSGLKGLAQRVRSVDGTFRMSSPVGGPTMMSVELPCPM